MNEDARRYWDRKIVRWSRSAYGRAAAPEKPGHQADDAPGAATSAVIDRLRRSVHHRLETAYGLLAPVVAGRRVLDLGCGTGLLCVKLAQAGAARVEGWDISGEAIAIAHDLAAQAGVADRCTFRQVDLDSEPLPPTDITVGLGLLDWLPPASIERLARDFQSPHFLFTFSEQDGSLAELVHRLYLIYPLRLRGGRVQAWHHRRQPMIDLFKPRAPGGRLEFLKTPAMRFGVMMHALPEDGAGSSTVDNSAASGL